MSMNHLIKSSSLLLCLTGFINCTGATEKSNNHPKGEVLVTSTTEISPKDISTTAPIAEETTIEEVVIVNEETPTPSKLAEKVSLTPQKTETVVVKVEENALSETSTLKEVESMEVEEESIADSETADVVAGAPSHTAFNTLLKKYVSASGNVNYEGLKSEKSKLVAYTKMLSSTPPQSSWSKDDKLAYWINVYNAFTIKLILDKWPVNSIMDINGGKAWDLKVAKVGSKTYSLNEVENSVIRPTFKEPRIHFAVNCAAVSCPKLLNEAYEGSTLNAQLEKSSKYFVNNKSKNKLSATSVQISKIFEWYGEDFKAGGGIIAFLNKYSTVKINSNAKITYLEYKWPLNK